MTGPAIAVAKPEEEKLVDVVSTGATDKGDWTHGGVVMADGEKLKVSADQAERLIKAGHARRA